ncbi:glycosyltransferase family 4 protein [Priestia megaterium]|uniref:glycosyltransferase family 4 protein n=1 Tax=Priestia megaterium TaxID=1404 RepID=UPI000BF4E7AE|nr:glycosyltransferase family 4 protein [Priestia megaterium]PFJ98209.1 glycosyltransferase WbuB [Priestia megaterium]PMD11386.1 glycosyltransferase WbuB [Priestia megaterium]
MNILYIHQYFQINSGGTRSYEFSQYLTKKGHNVTVLTGANIDTREKININIVSTNTKYGQNFSFYKRIKSFLHFMFKSVKLGIKQRETDIVFATSTPLTVGVTGLLISKVLKKKFVFEVRDVWPDVPIELGFIKNKLVVKILKRLEKYIYRNADHIIVLSSGMEENLLKKGIKKEKISVIPNLANNNVLDALTINKMEIVEKYPALKDKFICIHHGTMGFVNGLDHILKVAKESKDKEILYLLVGEGNQKEKLIEEKNKYNLENVLIIDGMSKVEVFKLLKFSHIGIMSVSKYKILEDNSANKFFDFLAAGKPVLLNYKGWQDEILRENNSGKGFQNDDVKSYYKYIKELKDNKNLYDKTCANSKKLALNYFDSILLAEKFNNLLVKINEK